MQVEAEFWATTSSHQRSATLADLLARRPSELGLDVAEALLEEAAVRHLDAWTPHIRHDPDAGPTLAALRDAGLRIGMLSNTHWPRAFHEHFLERDGLVETDRRPPLHQRDALPEAAPLRLPGRRSRPGRRDPATAVFVGDRPWDDISGAQSTGMRTVLRPTRWRRTSTASSPTPASPPCPNWSTWSTPGVSRP